MARAESADTMLAWLDEGEGGRSIVFLLSNSDLITLEIGRAVGDTEFFYSSRLDPHCFGMFMGEASRLEAHDFIRDVLRAVHIIHRLGEPAIVLHTQYDIGPHIGDSDRREPKK